MNFGERLEQLEASHIRLMTEREVEDKKNDRNWKRHRRFVREQEKAWEQYRIARQEATEADKALGQRISDLVSGIGKFIAELKRGNEGR